LTNDGVLKRDGKNGYDLQKNVVAYIRDLRQRVRSAVNEELTIERRDTQKLIKQEKALELAKLRGEMLSRRAVTDTVTGLATVTKNHVLAIPSRCSRLVLGLPTFQEIYAVLDKHCRLATKEISDFDVDDYVRLMTGVSTNGKHAKKKQKSRRVFA
jgi:hypothetical protein